MCLLLLLASNIVPSCVCHIPSSSSLCFSTSWTDFFSPDKDGYHLHYGIELAGGRDHHSTDPNNGNGKAIGKGPSVSSTLLVNSTEMGFSSAVGIDGWLGDALHTSGRALVLYDVAKFRNLTLLEMLSCWYAIVQPTTETILYPQSLRMGDGGLNGTVDLLVGANRSYSLQASSKEFGSFGPIANASLSWVVSTITDWTNRLIVYTLPRTPSLCGVSVGGEEQEEEKERTSSLIYHAIPFFLLAQIAFFALAHTMASREELEQQRQRYVPIGHCAVPSVSSFNRGFLGLDRQCFCFRD